MAAQEDWVDLGDDDDEDGAPPSKEEIEAQLGSVESEIESVGRDGL